ncbi:uncharacterized protein ACB058_000970 [Synchiropus picturatus]
MLQRALCSTWLSLLMGLCFTAQGAQTAKLTSAIPFLDKSGEAELFDQEAGSGFPPPHLLHNLHADSPFITEAPGKPVNCTQRFWLPPTDNVCWGDMAEPEDIAKSRLLVLQNRAALEAVSTSTGVEEGGASYDYQAREEVQGVVSDHQTVVETLETMEKVFASLEELRRDGKGGNIFSSMRAQLSDTRDAMQGKEKLFNNLENQFSTLEKTLLDIQLRISKLIQQ